MTKRPEISEATLIAFNSEGKKKEFTLSKHQGQYSIGRTADLALDDLIEKVSKRTLDPIAGYLTYIGENWYFRAAKGFRRGVKAVYLNDKHIYSASPEMMFGGGDVLAFGDSNPIKVMILQAREPQKIREATSLKMSDFDEFRIDFEKVTEILISKFDLKHGAKPEGVMQELQRRGQHDRAFEYGLIRVMRNMIAHPSPGIESVSRDYFGMARKFLTNLTQYAHQGEQP